MKIDIKLKVITFYGNIIYTEKNISLKLPNYLETHDKF